MKEMTRNRTIHQGGSVKKTLLVVALATVFVFAVAGAAFAGPNHSGQTRLGAKATAPANVTVTETETVQAGGGTTVTVTPGVRSIYGAGTNTYYDWNPALFGNAQTNGALPNFAGNSPHGNYTTTTVKCVVCHAVHYAAPGGSPVTLDGQTADTLLRNRADQACIYCHAAADQAVNGTPVYDGLGMALTGGNTGGTKTTGHLIGNDCDECHSSVHGSNADHSVASLDGYLLKLMPGSIKFAIVPNPSGAGDFQTKTYANMLDAIEAIIMGGSNEHFDADSVLAGSLGAYASTNSKTLREQAVGIFCAECHNGAYATGAAGAATNVTSSTSAAYTGHRIAAGATTDWNADGSKSSGAFSGQVAWAAADNCKSCHDATDSFGNTAFPHAWGGTKMWLMSAADAGAAKTKLTPQTSSYTAGLQLQDGVCLKCHVSATGTQGVGLTF